MAGEDQSLVPQVFVAWTVNEYSPSGSPENVASVVSPSTSLDHPPGVPTTV